MALSCTVLFEGRILPLVSSFLPRLLAAGYLAFGESDLQFAGENSCPWGCQWPEEVLRVGVEIKDEKIEGVHG